MRVAMDVGRIATDTMPWSPYADVSRNQNGTYDVTIKSGNSFYDHSKLLTALTNAGYAIQ